MSSHRKNVQAPPATPSPSPYMTADEFAVLTARGRDQIYNMVSDGSVEVLPIKVGRRLLWDRQEVQDWLDAKKAARVRKVPAS